MKSSNRVSHSHIIQASICFQLLVLSFIFFVLDRLIDYLTTKMKFSSVVPLIAVSSALVLPTDEQLRDLEAQESHHSHCLNSIAKESKDFFDQWTAAVEDAFHQAYDTASDKFSETTSDIHSWLSSHTDDIFDDLNVHRPHHGDDPHHEPNQTVYQLIAGSKYTTKLAELINEFDDLVEALNSTKGNFTVFAPTDEALDKIPEDAPKPSKKQLLKFLSYHVVPENYPAGRVLFADTAPTLLKSDHLGSEVSESNHDTVVHDLRNSRCTMRVLRACRCFTRVRMDENCQVCSTLVIVWTSSASDAEHAA